MAESNEKALGFPYSNQSQTDNQHSEEYRQEFVDSIVILKGSNEPASTSTTAQPPNTTPTFVAPTVGPNDRPVNSDCGCLECLSCCDTLLECCICIELCVSCFKLCL